MIGFLTLSEYVCCKKEVLGKKYVSSIGGVNLQICFPAFPDVDEENPKIGIVNPLLPPAEFVGWKKGEESIFWGHPLMYPSGGSVVELLGLLIECKKEQIDDYAPKIYKAIQMWEHKFVDFLKLRTKKNTERDLNAKRNTCRLTLHNDKLIFDRTPQEIWLDMPQEDWFATEKDIIDAIAFADSGKEFLPEYQLLLSAYDARRNNQNRRAIIDSCSAVEIALDKKINDCCKAIGLSSNILFDKYQSLGDKFDLLSKLDNSLSVKDYQKIITKPRNDVIHNREINPSDEITDEVLNCIEKILNLFYETYY